MINKDILTTGLFLSFIGTIAISIKAWGPQIVEYIKSRIVYTATIYQYDDLYEALEEWLIKNCNNKYRDVEGFVGVCNNSVDKLSSQSDKRVVKFRHDGAKFLIKYQGKRVFISNGKEKLENTFNVRDLYFRKFIITGYNAKTAINNLINDAFSLYLKNRSNDKTNVFVNTDYGEWSKANEIKVKSIDQIVLPLSTKEAIMSDVDEFLKTEAWYEDRAIPYKRGYLFYGPPGNGKTSVSLSIAKHTGNNVFILSLRSLNSDQNLRNCFSQLPSNAILLIEDIDATFDGRKSLNEKITFSTLLNCLDGALYKHGLIVIITTNHIEKLDPALIRTGRCDFRLEIKNPSSDLIKDYLKHFYNISHIDLDLENIEEVSMSQIQDICLKHKDSISDCVRYLNNLKRA